MCRFFVAASRKLQATSYKLQATSIDSMGLIFGFGFGFGFGFKLEA